MRMTDRPILGLRAQVSSDGGSRLECEGVLGVQVEPTPAVGLIPKLNA